MSATTQPSTQTVRAYWARRRAHPLEPAQYTLSIVKGARAFKAMDVEYDDRAGTHYYATEHDGITFAVRVEFDEDAYHDYSSGDDPETCPQWWVSVEVGRIGGTLVDSCGGIGGGTFEYMGAELDDETRAYLMWDFIVPAMRDWARGDRARWADQLASSGVAD